jgi:hypothetical protein
MAPSFGGRAQSRLLLEVVRQPARLNVGEKGWTNGLQSSVCDGRKCFAVDALFHKRLQHMLVAADAMIDDGCLRVVDAQAIGVAAT